MTHHPCILGAVLIGLLLPGCSDKASSAGQSAATVINPGEALEKLSAGNKRFLAGGMHTHSWQEEKIVKTSRFGQTPSVGILGCADSRVPLELVFDQGVGDLFVVRLAGFVESAEATGTFEYGYAALGMHSLVVLGHTLCGAVNATLEGKDLPGSIPSIAAAIAPGVEAQIEESKSGLNDRILRAAEEANVRYQKKRLLERSELLRTAEAEGKLTVLCAIYDVSTGEVHFLD